MIIIGEKVNGSIPKTGEAIAAKDAEYIREIARKQTAAGSHYLDCCASVNENELETVQWLIELIQEESDLPICIDSPNSQVCVDAMKFCKKPGIINSVSLEGDKIEVVFPVIADTEWGCIALLCDDNGIPHDAAGRIEVFKKLMIRAEEYGIAPDRLYIDPLVETLGTNDQSLLTFVEVCRAVKELYPDVHLTSGLSNISFGLPGRKMINIGFMVLAMNAGMDSAIIDPTNRDLLGVLFATEALLGNDEYCMEFIGAFRQNLFGPIKN
ncbi:MAG: methyltetrahydrofolate cobalamin methyltransferase [Coriobacteriaceae bacterium]|nr:methyltetrahydrofolate cobalamin methyltransferase [Coriobacteriaceae bacterium]